MARTVLAWLVLLALSGVVVDMHEIMLKQPGISEIMNRIEATVELLVMSAITRFVIGLDLDHPNG